tara:strand:+ start:365 stop:613 length:249 start_codon:yes stop_codon:yes gene_type:complete
MFLIERKKYNPTVDISEGDLVAVHWEDCNENELGIVLRVMIDIRNDDHLTLSEEILLAEVLLSGDIFIFDEHDLRIIEKCNV